MKDSKLLLDAVLHIAAAAIHIFIQQTYVKGVLRQRGNDEARICAIVKVLGLANYATQTTPAVKRLPGKVLEYTGGLAGLSVQFFGFGKVACELKESS